MKIFWATTLSFLFIANAAIAADYCPYRLVTFQAPDARSKAYGLVLNDDATPSRVADVTTEVTSLALRLRGQDERAIFVSKEMNAMLGERMCQLQKDPSATAKVTVRIEDPKSIRAAIPQPQNIVAMGLNAKAHAAELEKDGADGFIFSKNVTLSGPYDPIVRPAYSLLDYEVELGVVIRKEIAPGTEITPENVREYVAGFVLVNDVSNRAPILLDKGDGKFTLAKTYPSFAPVGPYYVPIESVQIDAGRTLPKLKMLTYVISAADAARGNMADAKLRQEGSTDEADFYTNLSGAVRMALKNKNLSDVGADGKPQMLLKNGKFEPGDLLVMGTIAGVALRFNVSAGVAATREGIRHVKGDTLDVFWPHYQDYFTEGALKACSNYDYGGPPPIKCMENWMRMKTWWVAKEYCKNDLYLTPGQVIVMGIEGLGMQINDIVVDTANPASGAELSMVTDPAAMEYVCGNHGLDYKKWVWGGTKFVGGVAGTIVLNKLLNKYLPCPTGFMATKLLCRAGKVTLTATLIGLGLYSAADTMLGGRLPTMAELKKKPEYAELAKLLGSSGKANDLILAVRGGMKLEDAVSQHVSDPALREATLRAIVRYKK